MSIHVYPRAKPYVVRWREDGRQRSQSFATREAAEAFDQGQVALSHFDDPRVLRELADRLIARADQIEGLAPPIESA